MVAARHDDDDDDDDIYQSSNIISVHYKKEICAVFTRSSNRPTAFLCL